MDCYVVLRLVSVEVFVSLSFKDIAEQKVNLDRAATVLTIHRPSHEQVYSICSVDVPPLNQFLGESDQMTSLLLIPQSTQVSMILRVWLTLTLCVIGKS